ncbi:hypothetical protein EON65_20760 [archaeon]|nr:MAG: hypothetical protein EON65_20760 [archaeon]
MYLKGTETIPKVMLVTLAILVFAAYWVLCVVYFSNDPLASIASVSNSYFPLAAGFAEHFSVSLSFGTLCMVPGLFASASGFLFSSSHVCHALSLSGLFSPWFKPVYGRNKIPRRSLVSSVLLQIVLYSIVSNVNLVQTRFAVTVLGLSSSYIGIFASYLTFKQRFPSMERRFTVPMGRYVAYVGIAIFSLLFVSVLIFQEKSYLAVSIYVLYLSGCGVYYFKVAEKRQFFSHEEQKKFMKAYILNGKEYVIYILLSALIGSFILQYSK